MWDCRKGVKYEQWKNNYSCYAVIVRTVPVASTG